MLLRAAVALRIGIARVRGQHRDRPAREPGKAVEMRLYRIALVGAARGLRHVEKHARLIVDRSVLLVTRLDPSAKMRPRQRGVGIRQAHPPAPGRLVRTGPVGSAIQRGCGVPLDHAGPVDVLTDRRRVHMHHVAGGDTDSHASPHGTFEDLPKALLAPAPADARQAAVVR